MYKYDYTIETFNLNKKVKFKNGEWISKEYEIFSEIVERSKAMRYMEYKAGAVNVQRIMHPSTLEDMVKQAMQVVNSPSNSSIRKF